MADAVGQNRRGGLDRFALDDLGNETHVGTPGESNVSLEFLLVPSSLHPVEDLFFDIDVLLSEDAALGRKRYRARREVTFPLVQEVE